MARGLACGAFGHGMPCPYCRKRQKRRTELGRDARQESATAVRFHVGTGRNACATERPAVTDPRRAFLFARIQIRGGGGSEARNGGAWARRRAGSNSRVSANDLRCARRANLRWD